MVAVDFMFVKSSALEAVCSIIENTQEITSMTLTLLLKSAWKKKSYFQQFYPFNLSVVGDADENMRIKYWGWKYRDEKFERWNLDDE